jgi:transcriptional regulator with XRE-family HTH domain
MDSHIVGNRVKTFRENLGLTQSQLSERAGIHKNTLFKVESGENPQVGMETLSMIARALGVDVIALLQGATAPEENTVFRKVV